MPAAEESRIFVLRACLGLVAAGCMIGGHVMDLEIAEMFHYIMTENSACMYNWWIDFDESWVQALYVVAYMGIAFTVVLYIFVLIGKAGPVICCVCCWFLVWIANTMISNWFCGTYFRDWQYNSDCDAHDIGPLYGLAIGSDFLPILGVCCIVCTISSMHSDSNGYSRTSTTEDD